MLPRIMFLPFLLFGLSSTSSAQNDSPRPIFPVLDISTSETVNGDCGRDLRLLRDGLRNQTLWAMQMYDASAQGTTGQLYGSTWKLGNFDECLQVQNPISAKYCLPFVKATPVSSPSNEQSVWTFIEASHDKSSLPRDLLHTAVCIPKTCSPQELETEYQAQLNGLSQELGIQYEVTILPDFCTDADDGKEINYSEVLFWIFVAIFLLTSVLGTFVVKSKTDSRTIRLFRCFSIPTNVQRLMEASDEESSQSMSVLHGIKVASILFIVYGHRFGLPLILATYNYQEIESQRRSAHNVFILQADLVVDTFFFISGVVATYFMCHMFEKKSLNPFQTIFARICRLAPAYYMLVWFQASAAYRTGSGPAWKIMQGSEQKTCVDYWWANLLFINNYMPAETICLVHSWFIPCDLHFFLLACVLVSILVRRPQLGVGILTVLTCLTPIIPALTLYFYNLEPIILFYDSFLSNPRASEVYDMLYTKSHNRVSIYLVGISVGYFLFKQKDSKFNMSGKLSLWTAALGLSMMFTPMAIGGLYYSPETPSLVFSAIFTALRRPAWGMGLTLLLFAHRYGPPNALSKILSCRAAVVLSKLTYGVYLIHFVLILSQVSMIRTPYAFTVYNIIIQGLEDTCLCFIFAAFLYILFELPIKRMIREVIFAKSIKGINEDQKNKPQGVFTVKL